MRNYLLLSGCLILLGNTTANAQCNNVALGKPANASNTWQPIYAPDSAFNGDCSTVWNAGNGPVQWIEVDLLSQYTVNNINLVVNTLPDGNTTYNIYTSPDMVSWNLEENFTLFAINSMLINRTYNPNLASVRGVRVETVSGPSWVSWRDIGVFPPSAVSITPSGPLSFCQGDSVTLTASPGLSYLWSTGDSIQSITVSQSGSYSVSVVDSTFSCATDSTCSDADTVTVTVNPLPTVTLSVPDTVCLNDAPFALTGGMPSGGIYSGPGVSGGNFDPSAAGAGAHTITYTYTDGNVCTDSAAQIITVTACPGMTENKFSDLFAVYPNPSEGEFTVMLKSPSSLRISGIKVINALGQLVIEMQENELKAGSYHVTLDLKEQPRGAYQLQLVTDKGIFNKKLIVE